MSEPFARDTAGKAYVPYALDQITIDSTAGGVALTAANKGGCSRAIVCVETAEIRYSTVTATAPTSAVGILAEPGDQIILIGPEIQTFKAIRTTASSALITVEYSR